MGFWKYKRNPSSRLKFKHRFVFSEITQRICILGPQTDNLISEQIFNEFINKYQTSPLEGHEGNLLINFIKKWMKILVGFK